MAVPVRARPRPFLLARLWGAHVRGRLIALAAVCGYFVAIVAAGGHRAWGWFQVPTVSPSFLDMRSITSAWECTRKGIDVLPMNPCDPFHRPANYPRLWLAPSFLGLGQGSTFVLGLLTAAVFFAAGFALMGRVERLGDALVWSAALVSPAVMLGVERGNADLLVFALVVLALALFGRARPVVRALAHGLFLFAAMLKLFPTFAFGVVFRQSRRWALLGAGAVAAGSGIYALATLNDLRAIQRVLPQAIHYSYGADVGVEAARNWLVSQTDSLGFLARHAVGTGLLWAALGLALATAALLARRWRGRSGAVEDRRELDAFWAGAGIYLGTWAFEHNWDYRLAFLLLTIPQLLRWSLQARPALPYAPAALAGIVATLWLSEPLSNWNPRFPFEEAVNWLLAVYLAAGLLVTLPLRRAQTIIPSLQ